MFQEIREQVAVLWCVKYWQGGGVTPNEVRDNEDSGGLVGNFCRWSLPANLPVSRYCPEKK
jgi:hypothetical protein